METNAANDPRTSSPSPAKGPLIVGGAVFVIGAIAALIGEAPEAAAGLLVVGLVLIGLGALRPQVVHLDQDRPAARNVALPLGAFVAFMVVLVVVGFVLAS